MMSMIIRMMMGMRDGDDGNYEDDDDYGDIWGEEEDNPFPRRE